ncbi:hypothetical protein [Marinicrinis lubricantis]|uniref:Uncharacterized protein n=1 Tax=Marinicrinis lubricantis TaxID=2086470 RepID=A0ABW1IN15_9BACL
MQIFATFEYTAFLEVVISELEVKGIRDIYAVPLELRKEHARIMDSMHRADGISFLDKGFIMAFLFATIGASKGFVWYWGPVIWGLIGAGFGFVLGILLNVCLYYLFKHRKIRQQKLKGKKGDVILIVHCEEGQAEMVKDILWSHYAIGLASAR